VAYQPYKTVALVNGGCEVFRHRGHLIRVIGGLVIVDDKPAARLVSFRFGCCAITDMVCYVAVFGGEMLIFEGSDIGPAMIDQNQLAAQVA